MLRCGMSYRVQFYDGDYPRRQRAANAAGAICYLEHHFNAGSPTGNYASVIVARNASIRSVQWGRIYARLCIDEFRDVNLKLGGDMGIVVGGYAGRGDINLRYTAMPAILVEPLFCSNPIHAAIIRSTDGQRRLARIVAESIRQVFPNGGLVAFSIGHMGKDSVRQDRGAPVVGGGDEAEYARAVLEIARDILTEAR